MIPWAEMSKSWALFLIAGWLSLVVYVCTLAPTITWRNDGADSGDLAVAVAVGGVPHPPGYPTYLLLGEGFKLLPFGDIAYRLNLLSATCAALSVAVTGQVIYWTLLQATLNQSPAAEAGQAKLLIWLCALSATLTLAFSGTFWSQATIGEVYALNVLFVAILLYGAWQVKPDNERWLVPGLSGLLGLGLGNHLSIGLLLPALIWAFRARWHGRLIVAALLAFCVGLSVYLVIPFRAATQPPINWGMATTWPNFLWLVSAEPYQQFLFALPLKFVPTRIVVELRLLAEAFMVWGLPVGLLGLWRLARLNRSLATGSLIVFCLVSAYSIGYNTTDSYVNLLPVLLIFSIWIGWGLYDIARAGQRFIESRSRSGYLVGWGLVILPLFSLVLNFSGQNLSQNDEALAFARTSLQGVAPGAVIITDDDPHTFALWYGRYGLAQRRDVAVVNGNLLPYAWYRQILLQTHAGLRLSDQAGRPVTTPSTFIELNQPNSPIYLATFGLPLRPVSYRLEPAGHLQWVVKSPDD